MTFGVRELERIWTVVQDGGGAVTFPSLRRASCVAGTSARANIRLPVPLPPGSLLTVRASAVLNSGAASIVIDYPSIGAAKVAVPFYTSAGAADLHEYEARFIAPQYGADDAQAFVSIGVFFAPAGDVVIYQPQVFVDGVEITGQLNGGMVIASGTVSGTGEQWVRYADGRQESWLDFTVTNCTTAWGQVFTSGLIAPPASALTWSGTIHRAYDLISSTSGLSCWIYFSDSQVGVARGTSATGTFTLRLTRRGFWRAV
jgi:hypothetical protein